MPYAHRLIVSGIRGVLQNRYPSDPRVPLGSISPQRPLLSRFAACHAGVRLGPPPQPSDPVVRCRVSGDLDPVLDSATAFALPRLTGAEVPALDY